MSDFSTYTIRVGVTIQVSAYDKDHAYQVADQLLRETAGVQYTTREEEGK
jgi:hypothetical protein